MQEYKINDFLSIRLEFDRTYIYVNGRRFISCIHLLINIATQNIRKYDYIDSIDEAEEIMNYQTNLITEISPETEFWGHCSVRHEAV